MVIKMSEKQVFLEKLRAALTERDISENDIAPYLERFDRFYDRMVSDTSNSGEGLLDDIERIADNIAEQVSEKYDDINRLAERTLTVDRVSDAPAKAQNSAEAENNIHSDDTLLPEASNEEAVDEYSEYEPIRPPEYIDEEPSPSSTTFWILCAVSLPITIPLAALGLALFVGVWLGMAALIIGAVALLIAGAAVGTALSLVGIIYGISQLFSVAPVGLYEIGLGVMIAAAVMFVGILLYNFAIRLLPLLMRFWGRFFKFVCGKLRLLFGFIKKECAKV